MLVAVGILALLLTRGLSVRRTLSVVCAALLASCSAVTFDLPPVARDSASHPGKFIWHDLISDDPAASEAFYSTLFGWSFSSLPLAGGAYWVIQHDGVPVGGMVAQDQLPARQDISQWVSVVAVADMDAALTQARDGGAEVLREPVSLGRRGTIAVMADPSGGIFAALDTDGADPRDRDERPSTGSFLWHELWTADPEGAAAFYARLTGLSVDEAPPAAEGEHGVTFKLLRSEGRVRAGVRSKPDAAMPSLWMPYLRVSDAAALAAILEQVPGLGGKVLVPAIARPIGGELAIIAGPSGAPVGLQTWSEDQPSQKEI